MNCVILQPSYIPWRGFFHLIHKADTFVFYDDVQYDEHAIDGECGTVAQPEDGGL